MRARASGGKGKAPGGMRRADGWMSKDDSFRPQPIAMRCSFLFPVLCVLPGLVPAQTTPFTYTDLLMLDRISGLDVDASAHYAIFNVRATRDRKSVV